MIFGKGIVNVGFLTSVFSGINAARDGKKSDWMYDQVENSPILYPSNQLRDMSRGATKEQKASIYKHMVDHDVVDPEYKGYYNLSRSIWDDFE